jgi:hypothetical protein
MNLEGMNPLIALLLVVTAANLALALFVLWHKPRAEVNRVFALTALSIAGWTFTNALFQWTSSVAVATQAAAFSYLSAVLLGASFLHFSWIFPLRSFAAGHRTLPLKAFLWTLALLIGLLSFAPGTVIESVNLSGNRFIATSGGITAIALFMVVAAAWAFGRLLRQHRGLHGEARAQSRYVLAGSAFTAALGLLCNLLLPLQGNYALVWLGPASSLCFVGFVVYAIVAQRLFDIRVIIQRTLLYSMLLAGITAGYSAVEHVLTQALQNAAGDSPYAWLANIGGAIVVGFAVAPVRQWLEEYLDELLFKHKAKRHKTKP